MKYSTCVYLIQNKEWLFLYRNKKANDVNHGKYIGVGGKVEPGESLDVCAYRETLEETGFIIDSIQHCGSILFQYPFVEDEICEIYMSTDFHGKLHECDEGTFVFVKEKDIFDLNLWDGDRIFLKKLIAHEFPFHFVFSYDENGKLVNYTEKK